MPINCIRVKSGVEFTVIAPGGFHILAALQVAATGSAQDITITSACDGAHSGPEDPHHFGRAYDIRTRDLRDPVGVLKIIMDWLGRDMFFGWIEDEGLENEHIHVQVRHGMEWPPPPPNITTV